MESGAEHLLTSIGVLPVQLKGIGYGDLGERHSACQTYVSTARHGFSDILTLFLPVG